MQSFYSLHLPLLVFFIAETHFNVEQSKLSVLPVPEFQCYTLITIYNDNDNIISKRVTHRFKDECKSVMDKRNSSYGF